MRTWRHIPLLRHAAVGNIQPLFSGSSCMTAMVGSSGVHSIAVLFEGGVKRFDGDGLWFNTVVLEPLLGVNISANTSAPLKTDDDGNFEAAGAQKALVAKCSECVAAHLVELAQAGCSDEDVHKFCRWPTTDSRRSGKAALKTGDEAAVPHSAEGNPSQCPLPNGTLAPCGPGAWQYSQPCTQQICR